MAENLGRQEGYAATLQRRADRKRRADRIQRTIKALMERTSKIELQLAGA